MRGISILTHGITAAVADCRPRATEGPRWQRLAALSLLVALEPATAVEIAGQLADQPEPDPVLSACALQIALYADEQPAGQKRAVAALAGPQSEFHPIALRYLALGSASLQTLKEEGLDLPYLGGGIVRASTSEAAIPQPPSGLTAEMLTPKLQSADPEQRMHAGSLLCLLGQAEGLPPLIESWNAGGRRDEELTRLVYRSIAALDDASHVPLLAEIYQTLASGEEPEYGDLSRFYWTIRHMSGPEILALRKRIRDEVGIDNLRNDPFGGSFP